MQIHSPNLLVYGASHLGLDRLANMALLQEQVARDLNDSNISLDSFKRYAIAVEFGGEGQCDQIIDNLLQYLKYLTSRTVMVMFSTCVDTDRLDYPAISLPGNMANHRQWFDLLDGLTSSESIHNKFICLIRRPSVSRAWIASHLISIPSVRLSFGSMCTESMLRDYQTHFPGIQLPILIDGSTPPEGEKHMDTRHPLIQSNLFNIVIESSSQTDRDVWRSVFITEKTFKAFGLRQIPIWFAVPGLVRAVRNLGFDLFDDLIDHAYDSIDDQQKRFDSVLGTIQLIDSRLNLDQCQRLRQDLRPRLDQNHQRLHEIIKETRQKRLEFLSRYQ